MKIKYFLAALLIASSVFGQNAFTATWPLTNPSTGGTGLTVNISGAISAQDENLHSTELNQYSGGTSGTMQRVRMKTTPSNTWPANITSKIDSVYVEFVIAPKAGVQLAVTNISMSLGAASSSNFKAAVFYSSDTQFINPTEITYTTGNTNNYLTSSGQTEIKSDLNTNVADGGKFYLRVYPWNESTSSATGKYLTIQNVVISGTTTGIVSVQLATISTASISLISTTSATSGGTISSDGGGTIIERGVCWNTTGSPTISDSKTLDGKVVGIFTSSITGLNAATKYYVKAYATNSAGTSYGLEQSFSTLNALAVPTVSTNDATSVLVRTATSGGSVSDWGGTSVTARGVCWNTTGNPTVSDNKTADGTGTGSFTSALTGLTLTTKYFVRAYATNSIGTGYGNVKEFTTQAPSPDVLKIVAQDGSGNYKTVQAAFREVPLNYTGRWTIFVKRGTYKELDTLAANKVNVILVGEDKDNTILVYDNYATSNARNPSATINANDFTAMNITFQNTSHDIAQALALEVNGDRVAFYNCNVRGYQDTFLGNGNGRIYFKDCFVEGTVDFIYGRSIMIFDNCTIKEIREGGYITAASTEPTMKFGINFLDCTITNDPLGYNGTAITAFYLGRPWQAQPRVAWIRCYEPVTVNPLGWTTMQVAPALYAEYKCTGPGYKPTERTKIWSTVIQLSDAEAAAYTVSNIFSKSSITPSFAADWLPEKPNITVPTAINNSSLELLPTEFKLMQNFPNPFNPSTTINYQISTSSHVTLKVFDLLGRELLTLVDEFKEPGSFNSQFSILNSQLCSGIYLYRMTAGNFSDTKKLILMK